MGFSSIVHSVVAFSHRYGTGCFPPLGCCQRGRFVDDSHILHLSPHCLETVGYIVVAHGIGLNLQLGSTFIRIGQSYQ